MSADDVKGDNIPTLNVTLDVKLLPFVENEHLNSGHVLRCQQKSLKIVVNPTRF